MRWPIGYEFDLNLSGNLALSMFNTSALEPLRENRGKFLENLKFRNGLKYNILIVFSVLKITTGLKYFF